MSNVFISYRREDSGGYALALGQNLRRQLGAQHVFMDIESIEPGVDFVEVIDRAVGSCVVLLAVIGSRWLTASTSEGRRLDQDGDFVALEIATALSRNIRVIPVLINNTPMPGSADLPDRLKSLARRNALEISSTRFEADVNRLVATIQGVLAREEKRQTPPEAKPQPKPRGTWMRELKLELGRIIDGENSRPLPPALAKLVPATTLDIVLEERLVQGSAEMEGIKTELAESCRRHGLLYDRTYYVSLWKNQDPNGPPFQVSAHAEDRTDPRRRGATGRTQDMDAIPTADPNATQLFSRATTAWDPGRWVLIADIADAGRQAFRLTKAVSTVGRASDDLESLANCILTGAPGSVSRRQLALEWACQNGTPGFRVYNLGAASVEVSGERLLGAALGRTAADLRHLSGSHFAWAQPGEKITIGDTAAVLRVEEIPS